MENYKNQYDMTTYTTLNNMKLSDLKNLCKLKNIKGFSNKNKPELIEFILKNLKEQNQTEEKIEKTRYEQQERDRIYEEECSLILSEYQDTHMMLSNEEVIIKNPTDFCPLPLHRLGAYIRVKFAFGKKFMLFVNWNDTYVPIEIDVITLQKIINSNHLSFILAPYPLKQLFLECARGPYRKILISNFLED